MLGPVQVDFLRSTMERGLNGQLDGYTASFDHTVLVWGGWRRAIDLRVTKVALKGRQGNTVVELPQVAVGFSPSSVVHGSLTPRRIEVFSPVIQLSRLPDGKFILRDDEQVKEGSKVFEQLLKSMLKPPSADNELRSLAITDAVLDIDDLAGEENWRISGVGLDVRRTGAGLGAVLKGALKGRARQVGFRLAIDYARASDRILATLDLSGAEPAMFSRPEGMLTALRGWTLPVSGRATATVKPDGHVDHIDFDLTAAAGKLTLPALASTVQVDGAILKGNLDRASGRMTLDDMRLRLGGATISGKGAVFTSAAGEGGTLDAELARLPFTTLTAIWPTTFKLNTRAWFEKNITAGEISTGKLTVAVQPTAPDHPAKVDFGLDFEFDGLEAHYVRPMPPVSDAAGRASLRPQFFELWIDRGHIADPATSLDVKVVALHGLIDGLDQPGDHVADILLALDTDVPQLLTLLDYKPLGYATAFGVSPQSIGGHVRGKVRFRVPLIQKLTMQDVTYQAAAINEGFVLRKGLEKLEPEPGTLALTLDPSGLVAEGDLTFLGRPFKVRWTETFGARLATPTRYEAHARLGPDQLRKLGLPDFFTMGGETDADIVLVGKGSKIAQGSAEADLKDATFAVAPVKWKKDAGTPGHLSMELASESGGLRPGRFSATMPDLSATGRLFFQEDGDFAGASLSRLHLGDTDVAMELRRRGDEPVQMEFSGKTVDLRPFLEDDDKKPKEAEDSTFAASVTIDANEAILPKGVAIRDMDAVLEIRRGELDDGEVAGVLKSGKTMAIDYQLSGPTPGVDVWTDDAGELLRTLGMLNGVTGGTMHISGAISGPKGKRHTVGTIKANDFRVKDSPMMAQMLTVGSLTGLRDILTGEGIGFTRFDAGFDLGEGTLRLEDGRALGSQLGIRMSGRLFDDMKKLDIEGTLAPGYTLNTVLDYVPLVGQIISGGKNEGLIAIRFSVEGTTEKPDVSVNPLSALTPGFLRNLFNVFDTKEEREDRGAHPKEGARP